MCPRSCNTLPITIPEKISLTCKGRNKEVTFALGSEGSKGIALLFLYPRRQISVSVQCHTLAALHHGKDSRYTFYRRLGGPYGWSALTLKISPHRDSIPRPFSP